MGLGLSCSTLDGTRLKNTCYLAALWLPFQEFDLEPHGQQKLDEISQELKDQKWELSALYPLMIREHEDPDGLIKRASDLKDKIRQKTNKRYINCSRPLEIVGYCIAGLEDFMSQCHFSETEIKKCADLCLDFAANR